RRHAFALVGQKMSQIVGHVFRGHVAVRRPLCQRSETNAFYLLGDVFMDLSQRPWLYRRNFFNHIEVRLGMERAPSSKQFVKDDPETEDIGTTIDAMPFATGLFRAHIRGSPCPARAFAEILFAKRQSKVGKVWLISGVEENIPRLDVSMDEPFAVSVMERLRYRRHDGSCFAQGWAVFLDPSCQSRAIDILGNDEARQLVGAADVVNGNDMRMVEAGDCARFRDITGHVEDVWYEYPMGHLDGHLPLQLFVQCQIDAPKVPFAENPLHAVTADLLWKIRRFGDRVWTCGGLWTERKRFIALGHSL